MATILDPRFKCLGFRTEESATSAKKFLKAEIVKVILFREFQFSEFPCNKLLLFLLDQLTGPETARAGSIWDAMDNRLA